MNIEKEIKREDILCKVSELDIFNRYYPGQFKVGKRIKNPFVGKDNNPSMSATERDGKLIFKCFNSNHRGDCISFVSQYLGLDYTSTIRRIAADFGISGTNAVDTTIPILKAQNKPKNHSIIHAVSQPFTEKHIEFLKKGFLEPKDMNFCKDTRVYALKEWWLNRKRQPFKDEMAFYYNLRNERGNWIKIYRPEQDKENKWKSTIPFTEMHGLENIKGCDVGIVTKSIKDGAFLAKYITPCVCVVQAEDTAAFSQENIDFITQNCKKVYLSTDSDKKGLETSLQITKLTGWKYINVPRKYLEFGINDWFDLCSYEKDPQVVIDYFKSKKVI